MNTIRVLTLGCLRIERGGEEIGDLPAQPVRCGLLLYLALERSATRDELAALFWPESDADRARHSLSQALYQLRRTLGNDWLRTHGDQVQVAPTLTVDALEVVAAADAGRDEEALAACAGPFLAGAHPGETRGFEDWAERWRRQLGRLERTLCRRLAAARWEAGDREGAIAVASRWVELDPLDDEAQHRLIELLAATGQRSEALRRFSAYEELIARELEVEPLDETKQLVARIRAAQDIALDALAPGPPLLAPAGDATAPATAAGGTERDAFATSGPDPYATPATPPQGAGVHQAVGVESQAVQAQAGQDGDGVEVGSTVAAADSTVAEAGSTAAAAGSTAAARRRSPRPRWLLGAAAAALVLLGVALQIRGRGADALLTGDAGSTGELAADGIVVLPFVNMSPDEGQAYFADGITEDLHTALSRIQGLRVVSRTSAMRYKGSDLPITAIARQLGVAYVLEGSVRRDGDEVRITAQLIDAARDDHMWAETYDRELRGIFGLQSEITQHIADALEHHLSPADLARIAAGGTRAAAAYDLLLRGREYLNRPGAGDVRKFAPAIRFFREALEADPGYARAHVGLSTAFWSHTGLPPALARDSALAHARAAVELDPALAETWTALARAHLMTPELPAADDAFRRALELDPNHADALSGLARATRLHGRLDESVRLQARAVELDPFSTVKVAALGNFIFELGDLAAAERLFRRAVELAPDHPLPSFAMAQIHLIRGEVAEAEAKMGALAAVAADHPGTHFLLGRYHALRGRYQDAEAQLARAAEVLGGVTAGVAIQRAYVARRLGETEREAALLRLVEDHLLAREQEGFVAPRLHLQLQALRGDRDAALATIHVNWTSGLYGDGMQAGPQIGVYWLDADPLLEELREDPAFQTLLSEIRAELDRQRADLYASRRGSETDLLSIP